MLSAVWTIPTPAGAAQFRRVAHQERMPSEPSAAPVQRGMTGRRYSPRRGPSPPEPTGAVWRIRSAGRRQTAFWRMFVVPVTSD